MRGRKPARPLGEVADAAVAVFTDKGFRPAGISDVAAALGLSHGALYTYVDSTQALPVTAPPSQEIGALLDSWASAQAQPPLVQASGYPNTRLADQELGVVIDALYGFIEHNRQALQLFARCAADLPELAQWYFAQRRRATLDQL